MAGDDTKMTDAFVAAQQTIIKFNRDMSSTSAALKKTFDILDKGSVKRFEDQIRASLEATGKFTKAQIASLKKFEDSVPVIDSLEKTVDSLTDANTGELKSKSALRKADSAYQRRLAALTEEYKALLKSVGGMDDATIKVKKTISLLNKTKDDEIEQTLAAAKAAQKLTDELDALKVSTTKTGKILDSWTKDLDNSKKGLASWATNAISMSGSFKTFKEGVQKTYEELIKISDAGLGGIYTQLKVSKTQLRLSLEELTSIITKNSMSINSLGGGAKGIKSFTDLINGTREKLVPMMGDAGSSKATAEIVKMLAENGGSAKNTKEFKDSIESTQDNFLDLQAVFKDSIEEFTKHNATLMESEAVQKRLLNLDAKQRIQMIQEIQLRDKNLRYMGLTNTQIEEFNRKLEDSYDPKKVDAGKSMTQYIMSQVETNMTIDKLRQQGDHAEADDMEKYKSKMDEWNSAFVKYSGAELSKKVEDMKQDPEMKAMAAANTRGNAKIGGSVFSNAGLGAVSNQGGPAMEALKLWGAGVTKAQIADVSMTTAQGDARAAEDRKTVQKPEEAFSLARKLAELVKNILEDPLTKVLVGAVGFIGGLAASGLAAWAHAAALGRATALLGGKGIPGIPDIPDGLDKGKGPKSGPKSGPKPGGGGGGGMAANVLKMVTGLGAGYYVMDKAVGAYAAKVDEIQTPENLKNAEEISKLKNENPNISTGSGGAANVYRNNGKRKIIAAPAQATSSSASTSSYSNEGLGPNGFVTLPNPLANVLPAIGSGAAGSNPYGNEGMRSAMPSSALQANNSGMSRASMLGQSSFAKTVGGVESRNDYSAYNITDGKKVISAKFKTNINSMSLGEIMEKQANREMFAVGRYQVIPDTLREAAAALKLNPDAKFDSSMQDKILEYIVDKKRPEIGKFLSGNGGSAQMASYSAAQEWAGLGVESGKRIKDGKGKVARYSSGGGYYDGDGFNKAGVSYDAVNKSLVSTNSQLNSGFMPMDPAAASAAAGGAGPTVQTTDQPVLSENQKQTALLANIASGISKLGGGKGTANVSGFVGTGNIEKTI